ncbi:MAG: helix-turn-helix domain-containing protein [Epsilonproteobacteria bacterium]|nr:helix-turn-helix domain-containing protein [Campylobacterota bacterium]
MQLDELGREIQKLRKEQKYSQADMERFSGITKRTLSKIENGFIDEIGIKKVAIILDLLGYELSIRPKGRPKTLEELRDAR